MYFIGFKVFFNDFLVWLADFVTINWLMSRAFKGKSVNEIAKYLQKKRQKYDLFWIATFQYELQ